MTLALRNALLIIFSTLVLLLLSAQYVMVPASPALPALVMTARVALVFSSTAFVELTAAPRQRRTIFQTRCASLVIPIARPARAVLTQNASPVKVP